MMARNLRVSVLRLSEHDLGRTRVRVQLGNRRLVTAVRYGTSEINIAGDCCYLIRRWNKMAAQ